jgi:uncharacterized protein
VSGAAPLPAVAAAWPELCLQGNSAVGPFPPLRTKKAGAAGLGAALALSSLAAQIVGSPAHTVKAHMVEVGHNEKQRCYEASVDGRAAGLCQYELDGDTVTFTHTVVQPEFEGGGVGSALAKFVLEDSRARGRKVVPACEFISAYIKRHGQYQNLVG